MQALDQWEERLEALFDGRPYDILDAALTATISKFPVPIQPFKDMIGAHRLHSGRCTCVNILSVRTCGNGVAMLFGLHALYLLWGVCQGDYLTCNCWCRRHAHGPQEIQVSGCIEV